MFNKIEFSDLYKFLTSIGLLLIASAFIIPWLFLNKDYHYQLTSEEFEKLIKSSQRIVENRNSLNLKVYKVLPWVSVSFFIMGIISTIYGIKRWKERQKNIDESQDIDLVTKKNNFESLNDSEIKSKAETEVERDVSYSFSIEGSEDIAKNKDEFDRKEIDSNELSNNLMELEKKFYDKIIEYNTFDYNPQNQVKIDEGYEVDILLSSYNLNNHSDKLIEIKYIQSRLSMKLVREAYSNLAQCRNKYVKKTYHKNTTCTLIIVVKYSIAQKEEIDRFKRAFDEFKNQVNVNIFRLIFIYDNQIEDFDVNTLLSEPKFDFR